MFGFMASDSNLSMWKCRSTLCQKIGSFLFEDGEEVDVNLRSYER